jgi:siroheme synthase
MLFMAVEHFKNGDAVPVYRRFREQVDFEVVPVITSAEAAASVAPRL